jgi:hypothetical protein
MGFSWIFCFRLYIPKFSQGKVKRKTFIRIKNKFYIMSKNWKKEIARDTLALGSIPFYFLVIIRAIIGKYAIFIYQLLIALVVLFILSKLIKNSNLHIARAFVLVTFTSLFYNDLLYTAFVFLVFIILLISSNYLKIKKIMIAKGVLLGIVSSLISYYLAELI